MLRSLHVQSERWHHSAHGLRLILCTPTPVMAVCSIQQAIRTSTFVSSDLSMCALSVVLTIALYRAQLVKSQIVKGNAIGSIFYGVGFATPGVIQEAFTGVPSGRRLLQDPYHLTSKV